MKRIIPVILVILIGVAICVPCFADGGTTDLTIANISRLNENFGCDITSVKVIYTSYDATGFTFMVLDNDISVYGYRSLPAGTFITTLRFINDSEENYKVTLESNSNYSYSNSVFVIPSNGYFDVTVSTSYTTDGHNHIARISSVETIDYSYSYWNVGGIISNIKNMFSYISGSTILPLFLVGVAISLGLVACRFIRKVMWSR